MQGPTGLRGRAGRRAAWRRVAVARAAADAESSVRRRREEDCAEAADKAGAASGASSGRRQGKRAARPRLRRPDQGGWLGEGCGWSNDEGCGAGGQCERPQSAGAGQALAAARASREPGGGGDPALVAYLEMGGTLAALCGHAAAAAAAGGAARLRRLASFRRLRCRRGGRRAAAGAVRAARRPRSPAGGRGRAGATCGLAGPGRRLPPGLSHSDDGVQRTASVDRRAPPGPRCRTTTMPADRLRAALAAATTACRRRRAAHEFDRGGADHRPSLRDRDAGDGPDAARAT